MERSLPTDTRAKTKRGRLLLWIVLAAFPVAALVGVGALYAFASPGGMRPSYNATDYDRQLTDVASSAGVIIDGLARYSRDHAAFPDDPADLAPYVSDA